VKPRSIYFISVVFLISCNHTSKKTISKIKTKSDSVKHTVSVQSTNDTLAIPEDTIPKITIPEGTIQVGEDKVDSISKVKILSDGSSYNAQDEVNPKDAKLDWKGIFVNKDNYYIKPTTIKFIKEHSEFDDGDKPDQKTGWRIKCAGKDTCLQLISGVNNLIAGPIKRVKTGGFYYAGQKQEFNYGGVTYILYTTGAKRNGKIYNFKIFLMATVKGHTFNQLIRSLGNNVALDNHGDDVDTIFIDFVGDIDGDKIPDFIISDGGYAFGSTSLYLSTTAGNNAILKLVGYFSQSD
jgi:hypothetical protein